MTLLKAYKLVKLAVKDKEKKKKGLLNPAQPWNKGDISTMEFAKGLTEVIDNDIKWLKAIRKQLPPMPKCKHPKELRDKCDGKLYCMGCNQDLDDA